MLEKVKTLKELWEFVDKFNSKHFPESKLNPIFGNGKCNNPKAMFVFINPTVRNISSSKEWESLRFPFIGTKQVWGVFHKAGLFNDTLMNEINSCKDWSFELTKKVREFLEEKEFYFTNLVKWTGENADLPNSKKIKLFLPILEKEIKIVNPELIVTFGLIPFESLANEKIKLSQVFERFEKTKKPVIFETKHGKVMPCYFPVGRGNPKRASIMLSSLKKL